MSNSTFHPRKQANQIQPVESDFKLLQFLFSRNKWLLLLFIVGGLTIGIGYYRLMPERFLISSTLLIKEENKNPELKNVFRQLNTQKKTSDIEDQIGLLKSYRLNLLTLEKFDWSYRWSQNSWLKTMDLYPEEPFRLSHFEGSSQVSGIPLEITALSDSTYRIQCTKTIKHLSKKQHIYYDQVVKFGEPFTNSHFHFTLCKKSTAKTENGKTYFLEFMDRSEIANFYKENVLAARFNPIAESNLISLKLETLSPQRDVLYLNKLMDVFLQYGIDEKNKAAENTIRFIDEQISGVNESLESAGATFTNFRTSNRTVNLDLEASAIIERQNQIEVELMQLDNRLDYYHDLKYYLENKGENNNLIAPTLTTFTDDFLKANVEHVNELFSRRQVLSLTAKEKNPTLISLDNEIHFTQKMLLENVQGLIQHAEAEKNNLIRRKKETNGEIAKLPVTEKNMIGMKRNFDLNNQLYTFLLERRAEAEITKASNDTHAQILDPASEGTAVLQGPLLGFNLLMGGLAGFLLGLGYILFKHFTSNKLSDLEEIHSQLEIAPVGSIPHSKIKLEWPFLSSHPRSVLAESFRGLRMNLSSILDQVNGKIIAVHAFLPGSGKSFVSLHLAQAFSLYGKKVLLIDADLQRPTLHRLIDASQDPGLSDYLSGTTALQDLIKKTHIPLIDFISSGSLNHALLESIEKERFKTLLNTFRKDYEVILIDNSPYGLLNDPKVVGKMADLNLFLIRLNHSKRSEIQHLNTLGNANTLHGLVVAVNGNQADEPYGYYLGPEQPWKVYLKKIVKELALRTNRAFRLIRPSLSALSADPKQKFFHDKK